MVWLNPTLGKCICSNAIAFTLSTEKELSLTPLVNLKTLQDHDQEP